MQFLDNEPLLIGNDTWIVLAITDGYDTPETWDSLIAKVGAGSATARFDKVNTATFQQLQVFKHANHSMLIGKLTASTVDNGVIGARIMIKDAGKDCFEVVSTSAGTNSAALFFKPYMKAMAKEENENMYNHDFGYVYAWLRAAADGNPFV
jgi:hypothetical protein